MALRLLEGDLIKLARAGHFDAIAHGCNCFCTMGAGIARAIREAWPETYAADCRTRRGDAGKLGSYTSARVAIEGARALTVINAYTQYRYGRGGPHVDHAAIASVFKRLNADFAGARIGLPKIGAGLAGGDWERIAAIIEANSSALELTVVALSKG